MSLRTIQAKTIPVSIRPSFAGKNARPAWR
jgi:hypothetical protein